VVDNRGGMQDNAAMKDRSRAPRPPMTYLLVVAVALAAAVPGLAQPPSDAAAKSGRTALSTQPTAPRDYPEVAVFLRDGQRVVGLLVASDTRHLTVRVAGIDTRLSLDSIDRYDMLPPILERYEELRKSIGDDPDAIVRLALWLQSREQYTLALTEVQRALDADRVHAEGLRLKAVLEQQIILKAKRANPEADKRDDDKAPRAANPQRARVGEFPVLSTEDMNLIRVFETDMTANPRIVIPRESIIKMLDANSGHPLVPLTREGREAIVRKPAIEVLDLMFKLQARAFYPAVQVLDTPPSIRLFREAVARTWLMSCATTQCHGGLEAGRLILENRAPNSDAAVYTNMLILQRFRTTLSPKAGKAEAPGAVPANTNAPTDGVPLINWDNPELSPLLHAGLPRADSLFPHPVVRRRAQDGAGTRINDLWRPEFRTAGDKMFVRSVDWMRSMYRPRPEYPVQYTPLRPFIPPPTPVLAPGSPVLTPAAPSRR